MAQGATGEWVDSEPLSSGDYNYAVQDFDGSGVSTLSSVVVYTAPEDLSTAQVGDYVGGGVYAGTITYDDSRQFHIIMGLASSEQDAFNEWKTSNTATTGTDSLWDGKANTDAMIAAGELDHPSAALANNYTNEGLTDWYSPAKEEWQLLIDNLYAISHPEATFHSADRWTSTQSSADRAYGAKPGNGTTSSTVLKSATYRTRPIRRVAV
ncbi:hypothetical protein QHH_30 [Halomonas phage QHHSV-1]|nr:hypothetical protein QHH_30 [Halomonas phage QHHSV-1]